jgi:methionyl-tRNA formyltransferase
MNIGIIGIGYWGKHYIRIVNNNKTCTLKAISDINKSVLDSYDYLKIKTFLSYEDMFKENIIDSVVIITNASIHEKIINCALKYKLNIFVEKPYTLNSQSCNLIEKKLDVNHKLMIGHTYLFNSSIIYIKNFIENTMENITTIYFEWSCYGPIRDDTTPIFDLAVHPLSILLWLFPNSIITDINSVKSISNNTYFITFKLNEILVSMNISWSSPGKTRKMIITNDKIKLIFDDVSNIKPIEIMYINQKNKTNYLNTQYQIKSDGLIITPEIEQKEPLTEQFNHWLNYINNKESCRSEHYFSKKVINYLEQFDKIEKNKPIICIAGKSSISTYGLKLVYKYYNNTHKIVYLPNPSDIGEDNWQPSLKKLGKTLNLHETTLEELYEIDDLIFISLEYEKIIKTKKFKSSKLFNIHFSNLPEYKGMYTSCLPILHGKTESGVTFHKIDDGIDTGDIIDQIKFNINVTDTARDLYLKYNEYAQTLFFNNIRNVINNTYNLYPQSSINSTYYSKKTLDFSKINIDFNKTAYEVYNQIRAFTFKEYQLVKFNNISIIKGLITNEKNFNKKPGTMIKETNEYFIISTIDYNIQLFKLM